MPRELESEKATLDGMEPLSKDPDAGNDSSSSSSSSIGSMLSSYLEEPAPLYTRSHSLSPAFKKLQDLHPYSLLLNIDDLDDADWLEHAAFEPHEAASREKVCNNFNFLIPEARHAVDASRPWIGSSPFGLLEGFQSFHESSPFIASCHPCLPR